MPVQAKLVGRIIQLTGKGELAVEHMAVTHRILKIIAANINSKKWQDGIRFLKSGSKCGVGKKPTHPTGSGAVQAKLAGRGVIQRMKRIVGTPIPAASAGWIMRRITAPSSCSTAGTNSTATVSSNGSAISKAGTNR